MYRTIVALLGLLVASPIVAYASTPIPSPSCVSISMDTEDTFLSHTDSAQLTAFATNLLQSKGVTITGLCGNAQSVYFIGLSGKAFGSGNDTTGAAYAVALIFYVGATPVEGGSTRWMGKVSSRQVIIVPRSKPEYLITALSESISHLYDISMGN